MDKYLSNAKNMLDFIKKSPSCYHVIDNFKTMLDNKGFCELKENRLWNIKEGNGYYTVRGDSSIIAFYIPCKDYSNYQICASHSDSPSFKIKENPEMLTDGHYVELNVEKYGGMIFAPWFDRPLSIAGRVVVNDTATDSLSVRLVNVDRDLVMIPNVAIHMNRDVNAGYKYSAQKDMLPILGEETAKGRLNEIIAESAGVSVQNIAGMDMFLYNRVSPAIWGADNEFISSTKLDDLECAYTTMTGFIDSIGNNNKSVSVCCVFDNEEVGSTTKQGADSTMLSDVLERINESCNRTRQQYMMAIADSFMVSADNAHAVHPHHQDKADPTNRPYMNRGIVIKYNANQKYTTDSISASIFKKICQKSGVPIQSYINNSDIAGGSTLGNIANTHVSLNTVDVGLAQLAMHSPYETAGVKDVTYMIKAVKEFYSTHIYAENDFYKFI